MQIIAKNSTCFQVRVFLGRDQNGKVITKTKTFHCKKKEIQRLAVVFEEEVKRAVNVTQEDITLGDIFALYLNNHPLTPKGRYKTNQHLRLYFYNFFAPDQKLTTISLAQGQAFILWLKSKNLENSSINTILTTLRTVINYAIKNEVLTHHPLSKIGNLPTYKRFKDVLNQDELKKLLDIADSDDDYLFLRIAIVTGARPEEYLPLEWSDVDFERKHLNIDKVAVHIGPRSVRKGAKNSSSVRLISLDDETLAILKERKKKAISKYIFPAKNRDLYLSHPIAFRRLRKAAQMAGIEKTVNLYLLRHSHATLLIQNGAPINEVSRRLGHSNIHTTFSFYIHATTEGAQKTAELFGSLMK